MTGRILGLDPGSRRVGVAVSDPGSTIAQPLAVWPRSRLLDELRRLLTEIDVDRIVVGHPVSLSGDRGPAAAAAEELATEIAEATGLPVDLHDERFTTVAAERSLLEGGTRRRRRREVRDKVAAAVMLQSYLDRRPPR